MIYYEEIKEALSKMGPRSKLYELVKDEMVKRGRWRNATRGKPFVTDDKRRKQL